MNQYFTSANLSCSCNTPGSLTVRPSKIKRKGSSEKPSWLSGGKLLSFGGVVQTFGLLKKPYRQSVGTCPVTRNFFIHVSNNEFGSPLTAITIGSSYFSAPKNINTFSSAMISASHELSSHTRLNSGYLGYCFSTAVSEVQKLILTTVGDGSFRMVSWLVVSTHLNIKLQ